MINFIKKSKKNILLSSLFLGLVFFSAFLNYIYIINDFMLSLINNILVISISLIFGIKRGINSNKKGYLTGLLFGVPIVLTLFIIGRILNFPLYFSNFIYYFLILISIILGAIVGKNKNHS